MLEVLSQFIENCESVRIDITPVMEPALRDPSRPT